jgi:hypothetical protein
MSFNSTPVIPDAEDPEGLAGCLRGTNLLNEKGLQHVYGDLIRRSVAVELRVFTR